MLNFLPKFLPILLFLFLISASIVSAQDISLESSGAAAKETLEDTIRSISIVAVTIGSALVLGFVAITILIKHQGETVKRLLFAGIVAPTILVTLFLIGSTVTLNVVSETGGPVHWHADFEIWDCGKKLDLINPEGFSNKVGTATLHEHNDSRIHVEGVVLRNSEVNLQRFLRVVGGDITDTSMIIPTSNEIVVRENGDFCPDGSIGELQVFVYKVKNASATQKDNFAVERTKLENPAQYVLSPFSNVPPGDCIIIEFTSEQKEKTDHLCEQFEVQQLKGNLYYGD